MGKNKTDLTSSQKEEITKASQGQIPAGITFLDEKEVTSSQLKRSMELLSQIFPYDKRKVVEKALKEE
jgi:hypothetical protein